MREHNLKTHIYKSIFSKVFEKVLCLSKYTLCCATVEYRTISYLVQNLIKGLDISLNLVGFFRVNQVYNPLLSTFPCENWIYISKLENPSALLDIILYA